MKSTGKLLVCSALVTSFSLPAFAAQEGDLPIEIYNRLRIEYDDNVRLTDTDPDSSVKIIEDVELIKGFNFGSTRLSVRYNPSFTYWADRDEDDADLHHELEAGLHHDFSERVYLSIKETFRLAELPELIQDGDDTSVVLRENNDFVYNSLTARSGIRVSELVTIGLHARHQMLAYDEDVVAARRDYDKVTVGGDVGYLFNPQNTVSGEFRFSTSDYDLESRDSESIQVGASLRSLLGPNTVLNVRAGVESQDYDGDALEDQDTPYADLSLNSQVSKHTRVVLGVGHSLGESPISEYASQERTSVRAGVNHVVTRSVKLAVSGMYSMSEYDDAQRVEEAAAGIASSGDEDFFRISTLVTYVISPRNSLQASWQHNQLSSDVRSESDYERNWVSLGLRTRF